MQRLQLTEGVKFVLKWIAALLIGLTLAPIAGFFIPAGIWEILIQILPRDTFTDGNSAFLLNAYFPFTLILGSLISGAFLGLAQWQLTLKDRIRKRSWIAANSIIVFAAFFSFLAWNRIFPDIITLTGPSTVSGMINPARVSDTWLPGVIGLGLMVGTAIGLPQWLVLRRYVHGAGCWIVANIAGVTTGMLTLLVLVDRFQDYLFPLFVTYSCNGPTVFGAITGTVLYRLLQHRKQPSE